MIKWEQQGEAVMMMIVTNINTQLLRARGVLGIFHILISISVVIWILKQQCKIIIINSSSFS